MKYPHPRAIRPLALLLLAYLLMTHAAFSASPYKIVTFGDSTTAPRANTYVYTDQLSDAFAKENKAISFVNRGIPGNDTNMAAVRFEKDVLAEKPQLVVIQFGINDSTVDVWKSPPSSTSRVSLATYEKNMRHFITEIRKSGGKVILMTSNQLRWTPKLQELYGKPPYDPESDRGFLATLVDYVAIIRKLSREYDIPLLDVYHLYDEFQKNTGQPCAVLLSDGMHPNTEGQRLVADGLKPLVEATIQQSK